MNPSAPKTTLILAEPVVRHNGQESLCTSAEVRVNALVHSLVPLYTASGTVSLPRDLHLLAQQSVPHHRTEPPSSPPPHHHHLAQSPPLPTCGSELATKCTKCIIFRAPDVGCQLPARGRGSSTLAHSLASPAQHQEAQARR